MKFSVLMSVYAKERPEFLDAALRSLVEQARKPDEIVVVQDGSLTKELEDVINKYLRKIEYKHLFKVIQLKKNVGLGCALNAGLKSCSYEIVARADSDDVSLPNRFAEQISYMENNPEVKIISANIQEYDESLTDRLAVRVVPETDRGIKKYIRRRSPFNHMAVVFRKSAVQEAGGYMHCSFFEDYYLWCRVVARGGSFYNFQTPLVHARAGDSMVARRGGLRYACDICNFQYLAQKTGIFSIWDVTLNLIIRVPIALAPRYLRRLMYIRGLRKES